MQHLTLLFSLLILIFSGPVQGQETLDPERIRFGSTEPDRAEIVGDVDLERSADWIVADLAGLELTAVTLLNLNEGPRTIELLTVSPQFGRKQSHTLELEARGVSTLSLESFTELYAFSRHAFAVEISDASGRTLTVHSRRLKDPADLRPVSSPGAGKSTCTTYCEEKWKLTCLNCSHGPFTDDGKVIACPNSNGVDIHNVYWRQNVPAGNWITVGDQSCMAYWIPDGTGDRCPKDVFNCWGDHYKVEIVP